jgi:hypothetical protein
VSTPSLISEDRKIPLKNASNCGTRPTRRVELCFWCRLDAVFIFKRYLLKKGPHSLLCGENGGDSGLAKLDESRLRSVSLFPRVAVKGFSSPLMWSGDEPVVLKTLVGCGQHVFLSSHTLRAFLEKGPPATTDELYIT